MLNSEHFKTGIHNFSPDFKSGQVDYLTSQD